MLRLVKNLVTTKNLNCSNFTSMPDNIFNDFTNSDEKPITGFTRLNECVMKNWVDINLPMDSSMKIYMKYKINQKPTTLNAPIAGAGGGGTDGYRLYWEKGNGGIAFLTNTKYTVSDEVAVQDKLYEDTFGNGVLIHNGEDLSTQVTSWYAGATDDPTAIGSGHNISPKNELLFYNAKIWLGDELKRDFVPAKNKETGEVVLYDLVENQAYKGSYETGYIEENISTININSVGSVSKLEIARKNFIDFENVSA